MDRHYQLAIIGGGIYGACLAREASLRGIRVLLLEAADVGSGTSFNSLKVIHGGLRYLQSLDVPRALYSANERRTFLAYAPELVRPMHCQVALKRSLMKNELSLGFAAALYNLMTFSRNRDMPPAQQIPPARRERIASLQKRLRAPLAEPGDVVLDWHDAQAIDTERFLLRFLADARSVGADIRTRHRVSGLEYSGEHWVVQTQPEQGGETRFHAELLVDCSGAAGVAEHLLGKADGQAVNRVVKAVNLVADVPLADLAFGFNTLARDGGRLLFCAPCKQHTLIGTWYFDEAPGQGERISEKTAQSCIDEVNSAFSRSVLARSDITQVHVGYLPRDPARGGSDPESWLLRHNEIKTLAGAPDLWVFKGTKYTTARHLAQSWLESCAQISARVAAAHPRAEVPDGTTEEPTQAAWFAALDPLLQAALKERYGNDLARFISFASEHQRLQCLLAGTADVLAVELLYGLEHEWAWHLDDLLIRRLSVGNLRPPEPETVADAARILAGALSWDRLRLENELQRLRSAYPAWLTPEYTLPEN